MVHSLLQFSPLPVVHQESFRYQKVLVERSQATEWFIQKNKKNQTNTYSGPESIFKLYRKMKLICVCVVYALCIIV